MKKFKDLEPAHATFHRLRFFSRIFSIAIILFGTFAMFGWILDNELLKRAGEINKVAMNPITAIAFILTGFSLYFSQEDTIPVYRKVARVFATIVILFGLLKLSSVISGIDFPFDQILFEGRLWEPIMREKNSMAVNTALNFILIGFALLLIDFETVGRSRPTQYICIIITLIGLLSIYGYVYGVSYLYGVATFFPMALNTAIAFLFASVGVLFARPNKGSMAVVIGENSGEIIFMRFIALVLPLFFGWAKLQGEYAGYYSTEFGTALFAILTYSLSMFFLGRQSYLQHMLRQTRKKAIDAIKDNEQKLQSILDNSLTPISIKSTLGRYNLINKQFENAFELPMGKILGKTVYDVFPEKIAEELSGYDHKIIKTGLAQHFEEVYPQKDGLHHYITVKFPLFNSDGKLYAIGSVSTDISERKKLENELYENNQRLQAIINNIGEGVVVADKEGNFILFNKKAEEILGTGAQNVNPEEWSKIYGVYEKNHETQFSTDDLPLFKAIKGESTDNIEMFVLNEFFQKGIWISATGRPVLNAKNEIMAGVVVFRDISIRKQLERLFSENEMRLKLILESIGEGIVIINKKGEVLLFNKKAEEMMGIGPKDMPAEQWPSYYGIYDIGHSNLYPPEKFPLKKALMGESTSEVEIFIKNKKISEGKTITVSGRPITGNNNDITGAIIDLRDVSEQKKLEELVEEIGGQLRKLMSK